MTPPPFLNANGKPNVSWKRVACVGMIWLAFCLTLLVVAAHGFPDRGWELLSNWLPWNVAITAAFIGIDSIPKLSKPSV